MSTTSKKNIVKLSPYCVLSLTLFGVPQQTFTDYTYIYSTYHNLTVY